jgi:threonine dehydrogenase-like Zn-dependent dehydrogenase
MKALTFHGKRDVRVDEVPDPSIQDPTDAIVRITSTAICGSDLHLYEVLGMFIDEGDILGHEPMGIVEEVGPEVRQIKAGDRVVIPFNISCGHCWMCERQFFAQCETTQNRDTEKGASLFGLGPIGQMSARIARHHGAGQVFGIDNVPERLEMARRNGIEAIDGDEHEDISATLRELTDGRGPGSTIDAVGMEAHGAPGAKMAQAITGLLPDAVAAKMTEKAAVDRLSALLDAIDSVRRGGTVSISGVYGGQLDPLPMMKIFDKGLQLRMGQAHVRQWTDAILPLLEGDEDPLGVDDLTTHQLPLEQAPQAYSMFQKKEDGAIKIVLKP